VEDLLSRNPVQLNLARIREQVQDKVLLITGAGGSIGSELARQIAAFEPRRLVLFERSENDLFRIGNELSSRFPNLDLVSVVGDILDVSSLREVFSLHQPSSVFHAAAYKHVPVMEKNCFQAVTNNIFGTYNVAPVSYTHLDVYKRQHRLPSFADVYRLQDSLIQRWWAMPTWENPAIARCGKRSV